DRRRTGRGPRRRALRRLLHHRRRRGLGRLAGRRVAMSSRPPARLPGMATETRTLDVPGAVLTYDVHTPERDGGCPPLFVLGNPMEAEGFSQLVAEIGDRTVLTYDPRGTARSTPEPHGRVRGEDHAADLHAGAPPAGDAPRRVR